jgi:hypothetical protein
VETHPDVNNAQSAGYAAWLPCKLPLDRGWDDERTVVGVATCHHHPASETTRAAPMQVNGWPTERRWRAVVGRGFLGATIATQLSPGVAEANAYEPTHCTPDTQLAAQQLHVMRPAHCKIQSSSLDLRWLSALSEAPLAAQRCHYMRGYTWASASSPVLSHAPRWATQGGCLTTSRSSSLTQPRSRIGGARCLTDVVTVAAAPLASRIHQVTETRLAGDM